MNSVASESPIARWLLQNGPKALESLCQALVYHRSAPILIADDQGKCVDSSAAAVKLFGLAKDKLIGSQIVEIAGRDAQSGWVFAESPGKVEQEGVLQLAGSAPGSREVNYSVKLKVLPGYHLFALRAKPPPAEANGEVEDYAFCLVGVEGQIAAWYAGSERIFGYRESEVLGRDASFLYRSPDTTPAMVHEQLRRTAVEGHTTAECWQARQDGAGFWANIITVALHDDKGALQGFARVARDFTRRHETEEKSRRGRAIPGPSQAQAAIAGIVSGEFDRLPQANSAFLDLVGYTRKDLETGRLHWPDLTPAEYLAQDDWAHEEELRFGACTPFEKELIRKDGSRVPVLVTTAVLNLCPFRWITFVQDLSERGQVERSEETAGAATNDFSEIVGISSIMKRVMGQVELVAPTDATVLILGETGTGKELVARALHRISPRRNLPFITLNCAAIPTGLLESELFGYERGAFTGALSQKIGRFEMAHRGTLFLDEVGDIPIELQPKLLRALQEKAFERLGGTKTIPIDVRLLAATNRNLSQMMGDKLFRSDLYYRLKVFPITTPPLRDRPEDIPLLARHFTKKYAAKMGRQIDKIPPGAMEALTKWRWPGNVRELENFIERSVILSKGPTLRAPLSEIREDVPEGGGNATLEQVERDYIVRILRECDGVVTTAATRLGLHRTTLNAMMRKLGISRKDL